MDAYVHVYTHLNVLQGSFILQKLSLSARKTIKCSQIKENHKEYLKHGYSKKLQIKRFY